MIFGKLPKTPATNIQDRTYDVVHGSHWKHCSNNTAWLRSNWNQFIWKTILLVLFYMSNERWKTGRVWFFAARSVIECMTQCSFLNSQCQSGIFQSASKTCHLFNESLEQLEDGNSEETTLVMKINPTGRKQIT